MSALVAPPENLKNEDVDNYFKGLSGDSEYDEISEGEELEDYLLMFSLLFVCNIMCSCTLTIV